MPKLVRCDTRDKKCPGYNFTTTHAYRLTSWDTVTDRDAYHDGNCGDCLAGTLADVDATIEVN